MKKSTKAALLSGLVFPGLGHLVSRTYYRAAALIASSLIAIYVFTSITVRQAMTVVDRVLSGELDIENSSISELALASLDPADSTAANQALLVFGVLWIIAIVDAWRQGAAMDRSQAEATTGSE